ncbi:MAG: cupin-like domain-containing protein [Alphaproteobacteria bacterium]|nr:cupin-like domain-containing protein [Alphaproteobacteria bacterium]MBU2085149.1 cupin-like domain-containing protein [Alphaproteobacteria bacterium]MBU2142079.1 cupin-like domain-containing protein [Alphaproteobacteria bacterium]MBU2196971.1 cupin-like domain-containing protein [Alphaproteobacteria bacterium]
MVEVNRKTRVLEGILPEAIPYERLMREETPTILKGVARDWPLTRKGLESPDAAMTYMLHFYQGRPVVGYTCAPELKGRYFYNQDVSGLNFQRDRVQLDHFLDLIRDEIGHPDARSYYIGSTDADLYLPGFREENDLVLNNPMFESNPPVVSVWIGNRTTATAHYDMSNNMACCIVGERRFTLFPPEQIANLYPGPLEPTPGGQVVSMVDFQNPDFKQHPRFADALRNAEVADLEPGDVLFYPALWWHHVEALSDFNTLVNYWWNTSPGYIDTPQNTLLHGLLSLRDRPDQEKRAWKALFDYYVFGPADLAGAHLPEHAKGDLAPMDEAGARRLRAKLLQRLNR